MLINNLKNFTFSSGNQLNFTMISKDSTISMNNSNIKDSFNQISGTTKVVKPFWAVCKISQKEYQFILYLSKEYLTYYKYGIQVGKTFARSCPLNLEFVKPITTAVCNMSPWISSTSNIVKMVSVIANTYNLWYKGCEPYQFGFYLFEEKLTNIIIPKYVSNIIDMIISWS
ncbi:hypothetical protein PPL_06306 [Heterostelium album PN500]|uniref:Uncharacterized protein n=1 Tax=Heterostelium pallidum (strain ATCC 26659 / Pp 5 / PN500) TaxID=670386 RepID=D3BCS8_HETP5|nr:hypothetical protein PPL_06306 [Heterostelium album PN500]EFA80720.1 hypothetical protein PPL_06306 [Heterostelium album PN500]|eukprot:XP_020432840.1 hypothetical protein PPL_06306 [Heterostelium album PN500]